MPPLYIGLMSGTSMDAIDAALISFENDQCQLIETASTPITTDIKQKIMTLCRGENIALQYLGEMDVMLGHLFAETALTLLKKSGKKSSDIVAIGSHGQTIDHHPHGVYPYTLQIADPNVIVARTKITTVADFRRRDVAHGGQGAPLVPAFHEYLFKRKNHDQWIVNIGGIANVTYLPSDLTKPIIGFDTGPGNTLLDQWCERECQCECEQCRSRFLHFNHSRLFDAGGHWARAGKLNAELLNHLLDDPYFQKPFPKSTGREYFNLNWLDEKLKSFSGLISPADIQNTLTELTAKTIIMAITSTHTHTLYLCGGGVKNNFLIERLRHHAPNAKIYSAEKIGIHPQWIEAAAFAWLAKQTIEKKPGNCVSVTGAREAVVLGGVYFL